MHEAAYQQPVKYLKIMKRKNKSEKNLIPYEKSRHVIYLDRRGQEKKKNMAPGIILTIAGLACIAYCIGIYIVGFGTLFFLIWGAMGVVFLLAAVLLSSQRIMDAVPKWIKWTVAAVVCAGFLLFATVEGMVLSRFNAAAAPGADYCIILGAQWKSTGPSEVLRRRLDRAVEYLRESPDTKVIVSGGQGGNEPISEAAGMKEYLIRSGIEENRILTEAASGNTYENLRFSGQLMDIGTSRVVIVTNNFHVFRAVKIAEKQGYRNVDGLAASAVTGLLPNNLLREFFGVVKDFLTGHL